MRRDKFGQLLILVELFDQIHDSRGLVHQFFVDRFDFLAGDRFHVEPRPFDFVQREAVLEQGYLASQVANFLVCHPSNVSRALQKN